MQVIEIDGVGQERPGRVYRCEVHLVREEGGGYSAVAAALPGAASCGDAERDALSNITEALGAVIASYLEDRQQVPWQNPPAEPAPGSATRWVTVRL